MITGKKVVIRQAEFGDEELLYKWLNDAEAMKYYGLNYGFLRSKESFRLELKQEIENQDFYPEKKTFIICKKETLEPIGIINYRNWDKRNRIAEFGLNIGMIEERGKGYGEDALYHFLDFMFRFLNLNKIELTTLVDNLRAQKLYERLGFKAIGLIRDGYFDSRFNKYADVLFMDLLRSEWE